MKKILFVAIVLVLCFTSIACSAKASTETSPARDIWKITDPDDITASDISEAKQSLENSFPAERAKWNGMLSDWIDDNARSDNPKDIEEVENEFWKYFIIHRFDDAVDGYNGYANLPYYQ